MLDLKNMLATIHHLLDAMEAQRDQLTELDSALGDGDLGVTMAIGCRAVRESLNNTPAFADAGAMLLKAGAAFGGAAASTMGVLIATGLMRAGKAGQGLPGLETADAAVLARAALEGIMQRGKASAGDKTVLDALIPAVEALEAGAADGLSLATAIARAAQAARAGADNTVAMRSRMGRAGWLQDRSVGHPDPGAVACAMALEAAARELGATS